MNKWIFVLLISIAPLTCYAQEDYFKFKSGYTQTIKKVICSTEYLSCLKIDKWECAKAIEQSLPKCPFQNYYQYIMTLNPKSHISTELDDSVAKLSECINKEFIEQINSSSEAKEKCILNESALKHYQ